MSASTSLLYVYVSGYGRSGSTLLDTILGNHPAIFGAGELTLIFEEMMDDKLCSCQEALSQCRFWPQVIQELKDAGLFTNAVEAEKLTSSVERLESLARSPSNRKQYADLWRELILNISKRSGKNIIVDSSKSTRRTWHRTHLLTHDTGLQLKLIHLVRDPRAVMYSIRRGSNRQLEKGNAKAPLGGMMRGLLGWIFSNALTERLKRQLPASDILFLRYEDFVQQPDVELKRMGAFLDVDTDILIEKLNTQQEFQAGHGVSGNRMRRQSKLILKYDQEWEQALSQYAKEIAVLAKPLAKKYGYM